MVQNPVNPTTVERVEPKLLTELVLKTASLLTLAIDMAAVAAAEALPAAVAEHVLSARLPGDHLRAHHLRLRLHGGVVQPPSGAARGHVPDTHEAVLAAGAHAAILEIQAQI